MPKLQLSVRKNRCTTAVHFHKPTALIRHKTPVKRRLLTYQGGIIDQKPANAARTNNSRCVLSRCKALFLGGSLGPSQNHKPT